MDRLRILLRMLSTLYLLPLVACDAFHSRSPLPHSRFSASKSLSSRTGDHSHCALLVPGSGKSSGYDHAFGVFNNIGSPHFEDGYTCVSFQSIDVAFRKARDKHGLPRPEKKTSVRQLATLATVLLETTKIISRQYNLPKDVVVNGLPLIDTFKTIIGTVCPDFLMPRECHVERYREFDGRCNNLDNPTWGSSFTTFRRRIPPDYSDGIDAPRVSKAPRKLPSPRAVSAHVHRDEGLHDHAVTIMTVAWGQAIDHDMTLTGETKLPGTDEDPKCCTRDQGFPECFPIEVSHKDPFYSLFRQQCISVTRSAPGVEYGCKLGPRAQTNEITSYIDANWVYGSDEETANRLRLHRGGLLKSLPVFREYGMKDLLPLKLEDPDAGCIRPTDDLFCFDAGDNRVNEQLVLSVVHTLMMREHNRIAKILSEINPHWNDEKIYQETRHIVAASIQHITYNEFLPMIMGKQEMEKNRLILQKHGYFDGYDPKIDVSMPADFVTAAFRFGHSLLPSTIERWSPAHKYIASQRLSEMLRQPYDLYKGGWSDQYIMGLVNQVAQAMDDAISQEVTNHLFQEPDKRWGMDLAAINMQRAREHGVPGYNAFRVFCGMEPIYRWDELNGYMSNKTVKRYSDVYESPDDIDLWSGGVSERPLPGSMVGPTFSCLIGLTFKELRYGDRFWYENSGYPSTFSPDQLEEIRKVKLSRIICDNSDDIKTMQVYAMVLPDYDINPRVPCASSILPRLDLTKWRDSHAPPSRNKPLPSIELSNEILPSQTKSHFRFPNQRGSSPENNNNFQKDEFFREGPLPPEPYLPKSNQNEILPRPLKNKGTKLTKTKAVQVSHVAISEHPKTLGMPQEHVFPSDNFGAKLPSGNHFTKPHNPPESSFHESYNPSPDHSNNPPVAFGHVSFGVPSSARPQKPHIPSPSNHPPAMSYSDDYSNPSIHVVSFHAPTEYCNGEFRPYDSRGPPRHKPRRRIPYSPMNKLFGILG